MSNDRTQVVATGTIGPKGPPGDPGPQGEIGPPGPRGYGQATFCMPGTLIVQDGTILYPIVRDEIISGVVAIVGQVPVGDDILIDIKVNIYDGGGSIFSSPASQPIIGDGNRSSGLIVPTITAVSLGDYLRIDVQNIGTTFPGSDLTVQVVFQ